MRETQAIRDARHEEINPYRRRFTYPKWTRTVTVLDVPRLFARLPEFSLWDRAKHEAVSREYLGQYIADMAVYGDLLRRYRRLYGDTGALISGGFYDSWPAMAKDACRYFATRTSTFAEISVAHWQASGKRLYTWRRLRDRLQAEG